MLNELTQQILEMVARRSGVQVGSICLETRLLHDLGIDGDDAEEFIDEFARVYGVDMAGFKFLDHFGPELWWRFVPTFFGRRPKDYALKRPIAVEDLVRSVERRFWDPA
jgi:hypothetical protein